MATPVGGSPRGVAAISRVASSCSVAVRVLSRSAGTFQVLCGMAGRYAPPPMTGTTPRDLLASSDVGFGLTAPTTTDEVRALEDLGVASLWVGGQLASPNPTPDVRAALARPSAQSTTAVSGSSILLRPLYPAAIVAKQLADIDRAGAGRTVLGVGIGGEYEAEFRACQVPRAE